MSGKASGSQPANGDAKQRAHHDGSAGRAYTTEQKAAVIRIKRCAPTAYYEILGLEAVKTTCSDSDIKKAYRKLSLLTHPDKNGYDGADEAFKLISKAFQVLSDPEKKKKFDQFGGDPDARFNPAAAGGGGGSPFGNGFGGRRGGPMFGEEEMTPEELFRQFFGGGFGGGPFGGFDTGPGFVFNLGGGPGVRVHQFGGGRPRRRPGTAQPPNSEAQSASSAFANLLPLLFLFILPLLSSLFSGNSTTATGPSVSFDAPRPPQTYERVSSRLKIHYFVNPAEIQEFNPKKWRKLDENAEQQYVHSLNVRCKNEQYAQRRAMEDAQGWFGVDAVAMDAARKMELMNCRRLEKLGIRV
ncbi:DnaJ-domain-containing protein [Plenodomus tracheiphilus IPT5]|uniref:DnaJ-domain-containing protein n=1 Tax=Plenodomus tracheiphilus IPT5 TaxID=1408161 RepID=A0A6A7ART9_9PLEO|nr:DnaJ-domain-containing protein [Plenodomus tracheiphilus IPT5]